MSDKTFFIFLMIVGGIPLVFCLGAWVVKNMELIGAASGLVFFLIGYTGYKEESKKETNPSQSREE